jgi:hypothetical protein
MIQKCYYCGQIYGEKKPLKNKEETSGECSLCHFLWTIWYHLWQQNFKEETATEFILNCRKVLGENNKESVIQSYLRAG